MGLRFFIFFYIGLSLSIAHAGSVPETTIEHESITSFVADTRLLLDAQLNDTKGINEARCYFKTGAGNKYLYVLMDRLAGNSYRCALPAFSIGSKSLEYFFLIVNNSGVVVRSTGYVAKEDDTNGVSQEQIPIDPSTFLNVYSELGDIGKDDTNIADGQIQLGRPELLKQLYGLRAGVYEATDIPDSLNCSPGYFGGFILDTLHNTTRPVKGFAPNLKQPRLKSQSATEMYPKSSELQLKYSAPLDLTGDDWVGYFIAGASGDREELTASVVQAGSHVSIKTSLIGLGHYLLGEINNDGNMLLYDSYDGEDWTTYAGPATARQIGIYDYICHPQAGQPEPPLNEIVLFRPPRPPSEVQASDGMFTDKIAVNWNPSAGATSYIVYGCTSSLTDSCTVLAQINTLQYDDIHQRTGETKYYRVEACDQAICSEFSEYDTGYLKVIVMPMLYLLL